MRSIEFVAVAYWTKESEDEARMSAARSYGGVIEPYASGVYVNDLADEGDSGIRRAYGSEKLARLIALKDRYDADNVFHLNHNIRPSGTAMNFATSGSPTPETRREDERDDATHLVHSTIR